MPQLRLLGVPKLRLFRILSGVLLALILSACSPKLFGGKSNLLAETSGDLAAFPAVAVSSSRYEGVAPLAVFFDSAGTTSTATTRPFHELDYQWDFDDANLDPTPGLFRDISAFRLAWLGNKVEMTRAHNTRFLFIKKGVISHNSFGAPGAITSNIKLHAPDFPTYGAYTEQVVVSSNQFASRSPDWMIELQPQSRHNDERLRNILVEKNYFLAGAGFSMPAMSISGSNITLRNNILNLTNSTTGAGFEVGRFGLCAPTCEPEPDNIDVFHNTFFSHAAPFGSTLKFITLNSAISLTGPARVRNNLGYAPNQLLTQPPRLLDDLATGTLMNDNSSDLDLRLSAPAWFSMPGIPTLPSDFTLTGPAGAGGVDIGASEF